MQRFSYYVPTEIVFGRDAEARVGALAAKYGGKRVLIVFGGGSVKKSGLLERIENSLTEAGAVWQEFGGVQPNPRLSLAREGVKAAAKFGADLILAAGGGSVIDTAKAIAHGAADLSVDIWEYWSGRRTVERSLPVGVVLTIAAAGSETSNSAVLTNEATGKKCGINTDFNRPAFAIMNPELTYTLPRRQLSAGIADIMMHTLDRYMTNEEGNEFTDRVAEELLKNVVRFAKIAMANHHDYQAMSELMWCGSVSHNGFTSLGRTMDFGVHKLGHELSGKFDSIHGETLTTMWGAWARYTMADNPARFAQYAANVWNVTVGTTEEKARAGIRETEDFWRGLGLPLNFTQLGIGVQPPEVIEELADSLSAGGTKSVAFFHPIDKRTAIEIYNLANR